MLFSHRCVLLRQRVFPGGAYTTSARKCVSNLPRRRYLGHGTGTSISAISCPYLRRTHTCGGLSAVDVDKRVVLAGWILPQRKVSNFLSFFPIHDSSGTTQLVATTNSATNITEALAKVPVESVLLVKGTVRLRPKNAQRNTEPTGEIEVLLDDFTILNEADHESMPFLPSDVRNLANDELRARFRYLDLRRRTLSENIRKRSEVAHLIRNFLHEQAFLEVETPLLLKSTPEGAREFLVPTRISRQQGPRGGEDSPPHFYALPQSPQQLKQLLICSGTIDKYYQIAKCFRDEDGRKDRQPEFTQIDMEMAFVSWGPDNSIPAKGPPASGTAGDTWRIGGQEVRHIVESLLGRVWKEIEGSNLPAEFPVMTYQNAMSRFGSDKPDTRFGLEIEDLTPILPAEFRQMLAHRDEKLVAIVIHRDTDAPFYKAAKSLPREELKDVHRMKITDTNINTWLLDLINVSNLSQAASSDINAESILKVSTQLKLNPGDYVWIALQPVIADGGSTALGRVRLQLSETAQAKGLWTPPGDPHFLWVTEFPLFTRADEDKEFLARGRWSSSHHPFTAPMWQDVDLLYNGATEQVRGQHYDLVLNGVEIGGGSVRIHDASMQEYIMSNILQLSASEISHFEHLLQALKCGAPTHGGIALGFDRLMAILCRTPTIRDVIAFPKTGAGTDPCLKSPAEVGNEVLDLYGLQRNS